MNIWGGDQMAVSILGLDGWYALEPVTGDQLRTMGGKNAYHPDHQDGGGNRRTGAEHHQHRFYTGLGRSIVNSMSQYECRPSHMRAMPSTSEGYCRGLNKMLFILDVLNIAFDHDQVTTQHLNAPQESVAKGAPRAVPSSADAV